MPCPAPFVIRGTEKRKCAGVRALMQNGLALPFDPVAGSHGPSGPDNGLRSQLGSHGSYMNACVYTVCNGGRLAPATTPPLSRHDRYVGDARGGHPATWGMAFEWPFSDSFSARLPPTSTDTPFPSIETLDSACASASSLLLRAISAPHRDSVVVEECHLNFKISQKIQAGNPPES